MFSIQERSHPVNVRKGGKVRSPSWNANRLSKDKLRKHLTAHSAAKIYAVKRRSSAVRGMEKSKISSEARHKEKPTSMLERIDR